MKGSVSLIIKPLKPPIELLQHEALNERVPQNHPQKEIIDSRARNIRAGYNGEQDLQYMLNFLPPEKYLIFQYLRIKDNQSYFQIDILLLSAQYLLIIEVKNIRDHVIFDEMGQVIRKEVDKEQAFTNPVFQVKLQHLRLLRWLRQYDFPSLPIEKIVVYSNSNTILKNHTNNNELPKMVMHKDKLLDKIEEFEKMYPVARLSGDQLMEISNRLLAAHSEKKEDLLAKYKISYGELIKGVICPECLQAPMIRKGGKWLCYYCRAASKKAHRRALAEYGLLVNEYIKNREAREFLQLESRHIVKQLLQKEKLESYGIKSGLEYKLEPYHLLDV
ncbi:NERD domain-containing protein [Oceanobacillus luteolus]|uniref:Nuclease-related domain-containing protein n=1 Tax=Oceanobacillus luteolus TaxID=1274358 RepID=A0ABW4HLZ1_9BACI|nr:nuclease-related domain-containing protein [Oceanobacillus luteolus]MCM3740077.1 NERD domain-containing protein [Oceanobacillus luteolus]